MQSLAKHRFLALSLALCSSTFSATTAWQPGNGIWSDKAHWSHGIPDIFTEAVVGGTSKLTISGGEYTAASLKVGNAAGDATVVELKDGSLLLRQDSLRIGEYTGSNGQFILNGGQLHCAMDVFVGAVSASTNRMTRAELLLRDGTFVGLALNVGQGLGSESRLTIEGSKIQAVQVLEHVTLAARCDPAGKPGHTELAFALDGQGVTPITIASRWMGLRIETDASSRCQLKIALLAPPPLGDITLVFSQVATEGTFHGLPEGAEIRADRAGQTYRWTLTYKGGASGHDLVLKSSVRKVTQASDTAPAPTPLWSGKPVYPLAIATGVPAFPGAEGYGADTKGGRDGAEIAVETLADSGPGSLRAALAAPGARRIAFYVGGTIVLQSPIVISEPFVTCDGANAPLPGITLRRHGIEVRTHDVVLRHFRIRVGDDDVRRDDRRVRFAAGDGEYALDFIEGAQRCIADHLSLSWSTNKILSTTKMSDLITIQYCILSESLNLEGHGYAAIAGGNRVTWHHNLFAHNFSRNVRFQGAVDADFRNNVIYDWGEKTAYGEFDRLNYVGNYLKSGPSTTQRPRLFHDGVEAIMRGSLYLDGNIIEGETRANADNWKGTRFYYDRETLAAAAPFAAPTVTTESAEGARDRVLAEAGATRPKRDAVDRRIVQEFKASAGRIVQSVAEAGGWAAE